MFCWVAFIMIIYGNYPSNSPQDYLTAFDGLTKQTLSKGASLMKMKTYLIGGCLGLLLFASCVVYKGEKTAPVTLQNETTAAEEAEAASLYNEGKYVDAITRLNDLLEKDPKNPVIWGQLGSVYAQINQFEYAEYALKQTLKYDPKNIKAMYNLSIVYTEKGDEKKALKQVRQALKISPKNPL